MAWGGCVWVSRRYSDGVGESVCGSMDGSKLRGRGGEVSGHMKTWGGVVGLRHHGRERIRGRGVGFEQGLRGVQAVGTVRLEGGCGWKEGVAGEQGGLCCASESRSFQEEPDTGRALTA